MNKLMELILRCIEVFEPGVVAASCGCENKGGHWPTEEEFFLVAKEFGLEEIIRNGFSYGGRRFHYRDHKIPYKLDDCPEINLAVDYPSQGGCCNPPMMALIYAWGFLNLKKVVNVTYINGVIRIHPLKEECDELIESLKRHFPQFRILTYGEWDDERRRAGYPTALI